MGLDQMHSRSGGARLPRRLAAAAAGALALAVAISSGAMAAVDFTGGWGSLRRSIPITSIAAGGGFTLRNTDWAPLSAGPPEQRKAPSEAEQLAGWEKVARENLDAFEWIASQAYKPKWTPAGAQALQEMRARAQSAPDRTPFDSCLPRNQIGLAGDFQAFSQPDRLVLVFENGGYRTIYLDGRDPAKLIPTYMGTSIGHWEGERLVVVTTDFLGEGSGAWPMSGKAKVTETFWLSPDRKLLTVKTVYEDPEFLPEPLARMTYLDRQSKDHEFVQGANCVEDIKGSAAMIKTFGDKPQ